MTRAQAKRPEFKNREVAAIFEALPGKIRERLHFLRELVLDTAAQTPGVGKIEEALRWNEPSFLTTQSKSGSMIRINAVGPQRDGYAMFFHCQTDLVSTFRSLYPREFTYEGNRAIVFESDSVVPVEPLRHCIQLALTYQLDKKRAAGSR